MQAKSHTHDLTLADGRICSITVGEGVIGHETNWAQLKGRRVLLVNDSNVAETIGKQVASCLGDAVVATVCVDAQEESKSWKHAADLCDRMASAELERSDAVVAVGGGIITDLAGFAAGIYQRGIASVYVPTSLLAQVDASVGGKTGINIAAGKNLVGVFHQPDAVIVDVAVLRSLPARQWSAGMAEVVKHAVLDREVWSMLDETLSAGSPDTISSANLADLIGRNIDFKASVVCADEREGGRRALLNLGHTFAHALEAACNYKTIVHGEAVACGLIAACRLSAKLELADEKLEADVRAMLKRASHPEHPLPQSWPAHDRARFHEAVVHDKKKAGHVRFILARSIGDAFIYPQEIQTDVIDSVLDNLA